MDKFKHLKKFNEMNVEIDWKEVQNKWEDYYEGTFGEADYDDEFYKLKSFIPKLEINWKSVQNEYFDYIEQTNNESDSDEKFSIFKKIVSKQLIG